MDGISRARMWHWNWGRGAGSFKDTSMDMAGQWPSSVCAVSGKDYRSVILFNWIVFNLIGRDQVIAFYAFFLARVLRILPALLCLRFSSLQLHFHHIQVLWPLLTKFNKHRTCLVSLRARRPSARKQPGSLNRFFQLDFPRPTKLWL